MIARFDTSGYLIGNAYSLPLENKKMPGLIKDENNDAIMTEFVGLRAKIYVMRVDEKKDTKKAKAPPNPESSIFPELAYRPPRGNSKATPAVTATGLDVPRKKGKSSSGEGDAKRNGKKKNGSSGGIRYHYGECKCGRIRRNVLYVVAKRARESVGRTLSTPSNSDDVRESGYSIPSTAHSYVTLESVEIPPLRYFTICVRDRRISALVDSGSSRTLFGREGIDIIKELGLPSLRDRGAQIQMANGQIVSVGETVMVPLKLKNITYTLPVGLLPKLAVPCIIGMDFLRRFRVCLDFTASEWHFAGSLAERYPFSAESDTERVCSGLPELTETQQSALKNFFKQTVPTPTETPEVTPLAEHRIDVGSHPPIRQRCYVVSPRVQEAIREEVDKMLASGIIEPSFSEWSNPIVMVKKPNEKYRFCLDFRKVNGIYKKDAYLLPNMNSILDKLRSAKYISTIDLCQVVLLPNPSGKRQS
ncbi:uncharacterized protein LOC118646572 [Monomorium pharaonis]|uniref:uncharacterized protein LOC118646572 n=1 Tax=Monomorium pharaonis TaxID=307658 RepID=UPI001746F575|nr:uncharacterized protein LOC118646572 [Monomorium pharaonis]